MESDDRLERRFSEFCNLQSLQKGSKAIALRQLDIWFREAGIIDMQKITTTDTGTLFGKFGSARICFEEFVQFLELIAEKKGETAQDLMEKLISCEVLNIEPVSGDDLQYMKDTVITQMDTGFRKGFSSEFRKSNY